MQFGSLFSSQPNPIWGLIERDGDDIWIGSAAVKGTIDLTDVS